METCLDVDEEDESSSDAKEAHVRQRASLVDQLRGFLNKKKGKQARPARASSDEASTSSASPAKKQRRS